MKCRVVVCVWKYVQISHMSLYEVSRLFVLLFGMSLNSLQRYGVICLVLYDRMVKESNRS